MFETRRCGDGAAIFHEGKRNSCVSRWRSIHRSRISKFQTRTLRPRDANASSFEFEKKSRLGFAFAFSNSRSHSVFTATSSSLVTRVHACLYLLPRTEVCGDRLFLSFGFCGRDFNETARAGDGSCWNGKEMITGARNKLVCRCMPINLYN